MQIETYKPEHLDPKIEQARLTGLIEYVLKQAKLKGASDVEAALTVDNGFSVNVRMGEVDTLEYHRDKGMGITVYFGQQKGSASTNDLTHSALDACIDKACSIAKYTSVDEYAGLPEQALIAFDYQDLDLYHPWDISPEQAISMAIDCEAKGRAYDRRILSSEGASVSTHESVNVYGNSYGFIGCYPTSMHSIVLALVAAENGLMQRDYSYTIARDPMQLEHLYHVAELAAHKTVRRLNSRRLKTQKAPIIFSPEMSAAFLHAFLAAIRGSNLYRKASFLVDHLGKPVLSEAFTLTEKPHIKKGIASAPFDLEGVRTKEHDIVKDGVLESYVLSAYSARKLKMKPTGNAGGVHNLIINTSDMDQATLFKQMGKGLYVTEVIGQGVNIVTGDYSRGIAGLWIENGEIQYPVEEVTIAGNMQTMLKNIVAVSNDVDKRNNIRSGSMLISEMMIAGE